MGEVDDGPQHETDDGDDAVVAPGDGVVRDVLPPDAEEQEEQQIEAAAHDDVDHEGGHPRDDARVVALQADVAFGIDLSRHGAGLLCTKAGGPAGRSPWRPSTRSTQRWTKPSRPTPE